MRYITFLAVLISPFILLGYTVQKETQVFAVKNGQELKMDIYQSDSAAILPQPCLVFVFGGGFKEGTRDTQDYSEYFKYFAKRGYTVVSIDYRLGMKDQKAPGMLNYKPLQNAIDLAVSDLYSATNYLLENAEELYIDPSLIILSGSSAGAITVLHADYEERDNHSSAEILPDDFRYAGVISFAGGIFSTEGLPSYTQKPAPTLFFHGSADRLVPYDKLRLFHIGMFGSNSLVNRFKQERYPYQYYSMEDIGHEVSEYPMKEFLPEIEKFITDFVLDRKQLMIDINYKDIMRKPEQSDTPVSYYN
ncbi:MAG: alpha/beta hydrolase [Fermentimonas sp.]|nr:alpha/beta hydrolase [Fermentimonas sp.]